MSRKSVTLTDGEAQAVQGLRADPAARTVLQLDERASESATLSALVRAGLRQVDAARLERAYDALATTQDDHEATAWREQRLQRLERAYRRD